MKCPVDDETLLMTQRDGVEIDYCPKCRGVWLDRGELDKIIEKSVSSATPPVQLAPPPDAQPQLTTFAQPPAQPRYDDRREAGYDDRREAGYDDRREARYDARRDAGYDERARYDDRRRYDDDDHHKYGGKRRKREGFLRDLFDF